MTHTYDGPVDVITSVQRRRRWTTEEKVWIAEETYLPGNTVSLVALRHGIAANRLFTWRRVMAQGALTAASADEEVRGRAGLPVPRRPAANPRVAAPLSSTLAI